MHIEHIIHIHWLHFCFQTKCMISLQSRMKNRDFDTDHHVTERWYKTMAIIVELNNFDNPYKTNACCDFVSIVQLFLLIYDDFFLISN